MKSHKKLSPIVEKNMGEKTYKKGYIQGTFDLFHIGHLNILRRCKNQCEYLKVGIIADEQVLYKGKKPVIPHNERKEIIDSLSCINETFIQDSMKDLSKAIHSKVDVVFVGDDWKGSERWNSFEDELKKHGIDVVYFPYTVNASTTLIKQIIKGMK